MTGRNTDHEAVDAADWLGRESAAHDVAVAGPANVLSATLDRDDPPWRDGDALPPAWHWLYFHEAVKLSATGVDGHPATGGFLPPVDLPRRMWAGNRMTFHRPLRIGEVLTRTSTVTRLEHKTGRSGRLVFVTVRHAIAADGSLATVEEHDIVYRDAPVPGAAAPATVPAPGGAEFARAVIPSPVLLFRFSALTMNSHRIHYDRDYCVGVEGHPGLVVHGPLTMLLLLDLLRGECPDRALREVDVRARAPLYDDQDFSVQGRLETDLAELWAVTASGGLAMQATARF